MVLSLLLQKQQLNMSWTLGSFEVSSYMNYFKSYLFGDNRSVVTSATFPHSTLTKCHNILAFHRVREPIAARILAIYWIQSAYNLGDMLSKH